MLQNLSALFTISGSELIYPAILAPKRSVIQPNNIVPKIEPALIKEPIHDVSSKVIGPDFNGDSFDCSTGKNGELHPIIVPKPSANKFTLKLVFKTEVRLNLKPQNYIKENNYCVSLPNIDI